MKRYHATVNGKDLALSLTPDGLVRIDGISEAYEVRRLSETEFSVLVGSRQVRVVASRGDEGFDVIAGDFRGQLSVESERESLLRRYARSTGSSQAKLEVHAPMPAMVINVAVRPGDQVQAGQALLVLEAMKMENEILAHTSGRVKAVYATAGKPVEKGELLLLLE
ncbi:MAG TPA: biotin/lipoyl-containing protein [Bacteroidota bacterium]|nr:biotin/lipoyl-containing protein [Bacteroidota bacterium]